MNNLLLIFQVDLAEENLANPDRIRKILAGKLFPMRALGYFAVVTGRGNSEDSIQSIRDYEDSFFRSSRIFKWVVELSYWPVFPAGDEFMLSSFILLSMGICHLR